MLNLSSLLGRRDAPSAPGAVSREQAAAVLRTDPALLERFEKSYRRHEADAGVPENPFLVNAKQAAAMSYERFRAESPLDAEIRDRIVDELLAQTETLSVDGGKLSVTRFARPALPDGTGPSPVTPDVLSDVPEAVRPQLAGNYLMKDVPGESYLALLSTYRSYLDRRAKGDRTAAKGFYDRFRQGLDLLDLDPVTYEIIDTNPASIGHWLPRVAGPAVNAGLLVPDTKIIKVPIPLLQLTRKNYSCLTPGTLAVADEYCRRAFDLNPDGDYFIKTGTYSSKFDFRNAHVSGRKEIGEIGQYLLFIHAQALSHAHYDLSGAGRPVVYGMSTTTEWAVRKFVPSKVKESIYHGMPLRTEFRIFVDFDAREIIGRSPYWREDVMLPRFERASDSGDPAMIHDSLTYRAALPRLRMEYGQYLPEVEARIGAMLSRDCGLHGQWSVDVMLEDGKLYLIDMAPADTSALYDCVPEELRIPTEEDWLPSLPCSQD